MRRMAIGVLLVLHGLAHASIGVWAAGREARSFVSVLWAVALVGYLAAGMGVLRVPVVRDRWKGLLVLATVASIGLLLVFGHLITAAGVVVDIAMLVAALGWAQPRIDAEVAVAEHVGARGLPHPRLHRVGWTVALLALVYAVVVVAIRPTYLTWGTTAAERARVLPGDDLVPDAHYRIDHAITIHAPADSVWPWLVQMGQDRGGFYSYDWLERLIGDDIRNADRVHPEWQRLATGDLVRATQPDYLGGVFGRDIGWRVALLEPGRALVLEHWGAFVVQPLDDRTTRLVIRTREAGQPTFSGVILGAFGVFVFEPAHFIMQRAMLRGIRDRAEGSASGESASGAPAGRLSVVAR